MLVVLRQSYFYDAIISGKLVLMHGGYLPVGFIKDHDFLPARRERDLFLCESFDSVAYHVNP